MSDGETIRQIILEERQKIAARSVDLCWETDPGLEERYGHEGRTKCHEDALYHLDYLAEAIGASSPSLFIDYVEWATLLLARNKMGIDDLIDSLTHLMNAAADVLPAEVVEPMQSYVDQAVAALRDPERRADTGSRIDPTTRRGPLAKKYLRLLLDGNRKDATDLILESVAAGVPVREIYLEVFAPVQHEIGRLWQSGELSVAQEHFSTAATQSIMARLYPQFLAAAPSTKGKVVALSVSGELHEIGIRMVSDLLELEGWDTYYLGANMPETEICDVLREQKADLLAISATMTFHIDRVRQVITAMRSNPECASIPIIVGGYPFNVDQSLWKSVGADGYAATAAGVVALADNLCGLCDGRTRR